MQRTIRYLWPLLLSVIWLVSCQQQTANEALDATPVDLAALWPVTAVGQTNQQPDGNRLATGRIDLPNVQPVTVELSGTPVWVTGVPLGESVLWVVALTDGTVEAFGLDEEGSQPITLNESRLPAGMPPYLVVSAGTPLLLTPPADAAPFTHPVLLPEYESLAYISQDGELVIESATTSYRLPVDAQADARILYDGVSQLLINSAPTDSYPHGIMGDRLEAGSLTLVALEPEPALIREIAVPGPFVQEGIAPIWADLNGDGQRDIILTRSNREVGAQIIVLSESGELLAEGPAIGQGNRWRHQLAVAPFGPAGSLELVDVRTPHIGGPTEFFTWQDDSLTVVATTRGYTSHPIGSRNLDMGVAAILDGRDQWTLLLPSQSRDQLGGIQREGEIAVVAWTLPLPARLETNIGAVNRPDGNLAIGIGLNNNTLQVWQE